MPWSAHKDGCQANAGTLGELPTPTVVPARTVQSIGHHWTRLRSSICSPTGFQPVSPPPGSGWHRPLGPQAYRSARSAPRAGGRCVRIRRTLISLKLAPPLRSPGCVAHQEGDHVFESRPARRPQPDDRTTHRSKVAQAICDGHRGRRVLAVCPSGPYYDYVQKLSSPSTCQSAHRISRDVANRNGVSARATTASRRNLEV